MIQVEFSTQTKLCQLKLRRVLCRAACRHISIETLIHKLVRNFLDLTETLSFLNLNY